MVMVGNGNGSNGRLIDTFLSLSMFHFLGIPDPPKIVKVAKTMETAIITWKLGSDNGARITTITIEYKNISSRKWVSIQHSQTSLAKFTLTALEPDEAYDFRMRATNAIGNGGWSLVYTASTHDPSKSI